MESLLLTEKEVKDILSMDETLNAVENAFREKGLGRIQMPPKPYLFYEKYSGDLRVMPAYLSELDISAVKIVNVHPDNPSKYNLPSVMAAILLIAPKTGRPFGLLAGTWITTMRTGAASGIATKYLSKEDSKVLALIGAGVQAETQLAAIMKVRAIERVKVVDKVYELSEGFAKRMSNGIEVIPSKSIEECIKDADIICTLTPVRSPIIKSDWIGKGVHINAIGADAPGKQELDPEILKRAKVVIDDWAQASHSGEINVPLSKDIIKRADIYAEIGEIVAGKKPGRISEEEITIFDSTGLAVQDTVTAWRVYELAKEKGVGQWIDLFQ